VIVTERRPESALREAVPGCRDFVHQPVSFYILLFPHTTRRKVA
jgi:hypothetical protein